MKNHKVLTDEIIINTLTENETLKVEVARKLGWTDKRIKSTLALNPEKYPRVKLNLTDKQCIQPFIEYFSDLLFPRECEVWIASFIFSWSTLRTAKAMGVTPSTIKSAKYRIADFLVAGGQEILLSRYHPTAFHA